jgi:uncharacterized radical SAM superfamily Fe-S cluster-containing enzyme
MPLRDYRFLGTTQSLCPECLALIPAKIIARRERVYFLKNCPRHGRREDFVCSDVRFYDRLEYTVPARSPVLFGTRADRGCPFDCGLCTEHEQHTCIGLVELTSSCNLTCPLCYASSSPGGKHIPLAACQQAIDRLVEVEGRPEVLQLSGGEPTIHPQFTEVLDYALSQPIDYVQINTNGIRLAHDPQLIDTLARHRQRLEVFFQLDGLNDHVSRRLRGEPLLDVKLRALELLGQAGLHVTLAVTLQGGVNDDQPGPIVQFAMERPWITGINFQPATYSGRHFLPEQLEDRITFPDVIRGIASQTGGLFREDDFLPLPCAHPNCHSIAMAWRCQGSVVPLTRFIDARENLDLLANGIGFTRPQARNLILQYLGRQGCCGGHCAGEPSAPSVLPVVAAGSDNGATPASKTAEFFAGVLQEQIGAADLFRITITSFLDAYNFDVRRLMKCCTHHILPSGHVIPFCAYNTLYRPGHLPLPGLAGTASEYAAR